MSYGFIAVGSNDTINTDDNLGMLLGKYVGTINSTFTNKLLENGTGFFFTTPYIPAAQTYANVTFNYTDNTYKVYNTDPNTTIYVGVY